ncbi:hypothetical protein MMC22_007091, partial [Lobaria immixta]|nr:hypothetical protein [Lobaria immixta]
DWSIESHIGFMDRNGINKSILSISSTSSYFKDSKPQEGINLTRYVNLYASNLKKRYPDRIGFFATLPLPLISASIEEIDYALDKLHSDGFHMLSNQHGVYLGDPILAPVLHHLNSRNATIIVHPADPCNKYLLDSCLSGDHPDLRLIAPLANKYQPHDYEYFFDSSRSFIDLLFSGAVASYPHITWIVSHAGLVLPNLLTRITTLYPSEHPLGVEEIKVLFSKQFFFDLAGASVPNQLLDLLRWVGKDRIIYGSDTPWNNLNGTGLLDTAAKLAKLFGKEDVDAMLGGNAAKMLRLK